jgi:hypothetical protein
MMLGTLRSYIDPNLLTIYDEETIKQLKTFIVNSQNKPIAARGKKDDAVMSLAIGCELIERCNPPMRQYLTVGEIRRRQENERKWSI